MKTMLLTMVLSMLVISSFAQDNLTCTWKTEKNNTLVKIEEEKDGVYIGKILSSDSKEVKPGTQIIRNVKRKKGKWEGQLYAPKRVEWYDAEFGLKGNKLEITISVGFLSRTIKWLKVSS